MRAMQLIYIGCIYKTHGQLDNIQGLFFYEADRNPLQCGTRWGILTLENVRLTDLKKLAIPKAPANEPLTIRMKNVSWTFHESVLVNALIHLEENSNTVIIEE